MSRYNTLMQHVMAQLIPYNRILVGFSGGLDSTVLLHLLVTLREMTQTTRDIRAIHVHHGLNLCADSWVAHCKHHCHQWQVALKVVYVDVDVKHHEGVEAAARVARYQAFTDNLMEGEVLLTAQHEDDQCETFFLALKRGSGPAGLSSMAESMVFSHSKLLRPLLSFSRQNLADYAQQHQIEYIEDDSNQNLRFDRNFLRLQILPLLKRRWPAFTVATARSASLCAQQEQLLDELLQETLKHLKNSDGTLSLEKMGSMSVVKRNALLRRWLAGHGVIMPALQQLQRLWQEVVLARPDAKPCLCIGQYQVRRFRQTLYVIKPPEKIMQKKLYWRITEPLILPGNLGILTLVSHGPQCIRAAARDEIVSVRFGLKGSIKVLGRSHAQPSKKIWQEFNIPSWQRDRIPLLYFNEQFIAACGLFITQSGQAKTGNQHWYLHWLKPD